MYLYTYRPICYCVDYSFLKREGGEKINAKNKIIVLSLLFIGISIHAIFVEPVSAASTNINSSMTNSEIQNVLDKAAAGDTINFIGTLYTNIQLTINKTLNIVTHVGTVLSGSSSSGSAVFLINGSKASGTQISGFNITGSDSGILVNNTINVNISNCNISASDGSAVTINKSSGTIIKKSNITNSIAGINISNSKNTKITGSTVKNNKKDGIDVENSTSTTINSTQITGNGERGVKIHNSNNIVVNGSTLKNNGKSVGISSDEGAVSVKNSSGVKITYNTINDNSQGVTVIDSDDVAITNNTINANYGEGILLNGTSLKYISIKGNDIEENGNGIVANYNTGQNINISGNIITKSNTNWLPNEEDSGIGIKFGPDYASNSETNVIEHNKISGNAYFQMRADDAQVRPNVGSNWYGYKPLICPFINYATPINMVIVKIGANTYTVKFNDGQTGALATDLPPIMVNFIAGNISQMGWTSNGQIAFQVDSGFAGLITAIAEKMKTYTNQTAQNQNSSGGDPSTPTDLGGGTGSDPGSGTGGAKGGTGGDPNSGTTSSASSSVGQAAASGSAGNSGQSGSDSKKTKTAQELFIENTVKNPTVWGIAGIIVLLLIIFGAYYRKDLMNMIEKSKK